MLNNLQHTGKNSAKGLHRSNRFLVNKNDIRRQICLNKTTF